MILSRKILNLGFLCNGLTIILKTGRFDNVGLAVSVSSGTR